ncbi:DUF2971 domain-containing protein [Sphingomonas sp. Leaf208]|uniref:DUF2971 domain-containing protein n=1 Tax=Sphingomonas sp. Leaf208 TaxID=1735679 RepID=UPI0012E1F231|nr:DUF2971 domain-containing protein [Sphingomonas sp. Leaf208]
MILYKYVSALRAIQIIKDRQIQFSLPRYFNDPFDRPLNPIARSRDLWGDLMGPLRADIKSRIWEANSGVLSLTRIPTNSLMWAHYADSHKGVVLGFDVEEAGFLERQTNLIPAHFGSVIYSRRRVLDDYSTEEANPLTIGGTYRFDISNYEKLQRLFLTKPLDWAYEEEVRVVKCVLGMTVGHSETESGIFDVVETAEGLRYLYNLPIKSLKEMYYGVRCNPKPFRELNYNGISMSFNLCELNHDTYELTSKHVGSFPIYSV